MPAIDLLKSYLQQANGQAPQTPDPADPAQPGDQVAAFARAYAPAAQRAGSALGVDPSLLLAQWGEESGWGKSVVPGTNNLGNIKDFNGGGVAATDNQTGSSDNYRAFADPGAFADHYAGLIQRKYPGAVGAGSDAARYYGALKAGGYAQDQDYASKLQAAHATLLAHTGLQPDLASGQMQPVKQAPADPYAAILAAGLSAKPPAPPAEQGSNLVRGVKASFQQLPQLGYGLLAGAGAQLENAVGEGGIATGIKKAGIAGYKDWGDTIQKDAKPSDSLTYSWDQAKQGNLGALADWLAYGIGYSGGQGAQMLATGGLGSIVGKATLGTVAEKVAAGLVAKEAARLTEAAVAKESARIAATQAGAQLTADQLASQAAAVVAARGSTDQLAKVATANVAAHLGQTAAIGANAFGMEGGEIYGDLTSSNPDKVLDGHQLAKAFGATLAAGGLEFLSDKVGLEVMLNKSPFMKPAEAMAGVKGKIARAGLGVAGGAPTEAATEYAQTMLEEYGKGNDPFSADTRTQAIDAAGLGAIGGVTHGVVGGAISKPQQHPVAPGVGTPAAGQTAPGQAASGTPAAPVAPAAPPPLPPNAGPLARANHAAATAQAATGAVPIDAATAGPEPAAATDQTSADGLAPPPPEMPSAEERLTQIDARLDQLRAIGRGTPDVAARRYTPDEEAEYKRLTNEKAALAPRNPSPQDRLQLLEPAIDAAETRRIQEDDARQAAAHAQATAAAQAEYLDKQHLQRQSELDAIHGRVEARQATQSRNARMDLLDQVLTDKGDASPAAKLRAFSARLGEQGYQNIAPSPDEIAHVQRHTDVATAFNAPEYAAPNELVDAVPERTAPAPAPATVNTAAVDAAIAAGMRLKTATGNLLHKKGSTKVFKLSTAQKAHYLKRMAQLASGQATPAAPSLEDANGLHAADAGGRHDGLAGAENPAQERPGEPRAGAVDQAPGQDRAGVPAGPAAGAGPGVPAANEAAHGQPALNAEPGHASDIIDLALAEIRRPNGAIGTQGVTESQVRDVLEHAAGLNLPAGTGMRALVDAIKADPAAQARLRAFTAAHPIQAQELPDGSLHLKDGHHRAFLLNQLGDATVPAQVQDYTGPSTHRPAQESSPAEKNNLPTPKAEPTPPSGEPTHPHDAAVADLAGHKLDREWTAFAPDSGTLGIPREDMPQIKAEHRGALTQFLKARGIGHEQEEVLPSTLKATQREFSHAKVEQAKAHEGGDRAILVSSDNRVLDGHHQWLANLEDDKPIRVIRFDAPIGKLIAEAKEFPSAEVADGATGQPADDLARVRSAKDRASYVRAVRNLGENLPDGTTLHDEVTGVTWTVTRKTSNAGTQSIIFTDDGDSAASFSFERRQGEDQWRQLGDIPAMAGVTVHRATPVTEATADQAPPAKSANPAAPAPVRLSIGKTPNSTEPITVRDGVVHIGDYPAQDFDSGENVSVPHDASPQQIKDALAKAGAIARGNRIFGMPKDAVPAKPEQHQPMPSADNGTPATTEGTPVRDDRGMPDEDPLDAELQAALGHFADVAADVFGAKLNATGQKHTAGDLLPALSKIVELLVRKGFRSFNAAIGNATKAMRANPQAAAYVDQISARQWKAAYNAIAEYHDGTDSEDAVAALPADEVLKLVAPATAVNAPAAPQEAAAPVAHNGTPEAAGETMAKGDPKDSTDAARRLGALYRNWVAKDDHRISAHPDDETLAKYAKWGQDILDGKSPLSKAEDFERYIRLSEYGRKFGFDLSTINQAYENGQDIAPDGTLAKRAGAATAAPAAESGAQPDILGHTGKPFMTKFGAEKALKDQGLSATHEVVKTADGYVGRVKQAAEAMVPHPAATTAEAIDDGIRVRHGKGSIKDKFLADVDGESVPGGPWDTPEAAHVGALEWRERKAQAAASDAAARNRKDVLVARLKAGGEVTDGDLGMLNLRGGSSDLRWFIPAAADLFGIPSRAVRPHLAGLVRIGHTDMGAKREFVAPAKALAQIAQQLATTAHRDAAPPPAHAQPVAHPQEGAPVGKNADLYDGTIIRDAKGQQYRVHSMRNSLIRAHPIVDGNPQVNRDTTVRFWTDPETPPAGEHDRTDPVYVVGNDRRAAPQPAPAEQVPAPTQAKPARTDQIGDQHKARDAAAVSDATPPEDYAGFGANLPPMQRTRMQAALAQQMRFDGRFDTRKAEIERRVAAGARIEPHDKDGRRLHSADRGYVTESDITKTAMDYAAHLIARRDGPQHTAPTTAAPAESPVHPEGSPEYAALDQRAKVNDAKVDALSDDQVRAMYAAMNLAGATQSVDKLRETIKAEHPDDVEAGLAALAAPAEQAEHIENGHAELATPTIITASLKKSADHTVMNNEEARADLIQKINAAILAAGADTTTNAEDAELHAAGQALLKARSALTAAKSGVETAAAKATLAAAEQRAVAARKAAHFIVFDVPGDGKFTVANNKENLTAFRDRVMATEGFKGRPRPQKSSARLGTSPETAIHDMLEQGEQVAAHALAKEIGKPFRFTVNEKDGTPNLYTDARDVTDLPHGVTGYVGRLYGAKKAPWLVIEKHSGMSIGYGATSAAAAVNVARSRLDTATSDGIANSIQKMAAKAPDQAALEAAWLARAEQSDEAFAQRAAAASDKLAKEKDAKATADQALAKITDPGDYIREVAGASVVNMGESGVDRVLNMPGADVPTLAALILAKRPALAPAVFRNLQKLDFIRTLDGDIVNWQGKPGAAPMAQQPAAPAAPAVDTKPAIPEGYKPAGEPYYSNGVPTQGYAPYAPGERVVDTDSRHHGVIESMVGPGPVFQSAIVKFDNGNSLKVPFARMEGEQGKAARQPWEMTLDEFTATKLANSKYQAAITADASALASFNDDAERDWRKALAARAAVGRIPDAVLDDVVARFGYNYVASNFRGVSEPGAAGYLSPDIRNPVAAATKARTVTPDSLNVLRNPAEQGDIVRLADGSEWEARQGYTGMGWSLVKDKQTHPLVTNADGQHDFIARILKADEAAKERVRADTQAALGADGRIFGMRPEQLGAKQRGGMTDDGQWYDPEAKARRDADEIEGRRKLVEQQRADNAARVEQAATDPRIQALKDGGIHDSQLLQAAHELKEGDDSLVKDLARIKGITLPEVPGAAAPTASETPDTLTPDQAKKQMTWRDLGQRDGVITHRLMFNEDGPGDGSGSITIANVQKIDGGKWEIDGERYDTLKDAKKAATEVGLAYLRREGYVAKEDAAAAAAAPKPREAWQIAAHDFVKHGEANPFFDQSFQGGDGEYLRTTHAHHEQAVKDALAEGKDVPPEVLADYPDLKPVVERAAEHTAAPEQDQTQAQESTATDPLAIIRDIAKSRPFDKYEDVRDAALAAVKERTGKNWSEHEEARGSMMRDPLSEAIHAGQYAGMHDYAASLPVHISEHAISMSAATRAFQGTSHSPEARGASARRGYFRAVMDLWKRFEAAYRAAPEDRQHDFVEAFNTAAAHYAALTNNYLSAHSRVASSMIAGPARFPVESNRKKSEAADKRAQEADQYLDKAAKQLARVLRGAVDQSLSSELKNAEAKLAAREKAQEQYKAINAALRKNDDAALRALGLDDAQIAALKKPDFAGRTGVPAYQLQNNNAEIRRLRDRVEEIQRRVADAEAHADDAAAQAADNEARENGDDVEKRGPRMVRNAALNRLQLFFDDKPAAEIREQLKSNGFKWSPSNGAWQRQLTDNAVREAQAILDSLAPAEASAPEDAEAAPPALNIGDRIRFEPRAGEDAGTHPVEGTVEQVDTMQAGNLRITLRDATGETRHVFSHQGTITNLSAAGDAALMGKLRPESDADLAPMPPEMAASIARLAAGERQALATHYGAPAGSAGFMSRLLADVVAFVNHGAQMVAAAIRSIVQKIAHGVLATALVFNPQATSNIHFDLDRAFTQTRVAPITAVADAAVGMSPMARATYEMMAPVAMQRGKGFIIADKPSAQVHAFDKDGKHVASSAALFGKQAGDVKTTVNARGQRITVHNMTEADKITPAGAFVGRVEDDAGYTGGRLMMLYDARTGKQVGGVAVHAVWTGDAKEQRRQRLASPDLRDHKISFGCINTNDSFMLDKLLPLADQFDDGLVLIVPEQKALGEVFTPLTGTVTETRIEHPQSAGRRALPEMPGKEETPYHAEANDDREGDAAGDEPDGLMGNLRAAPGFYSELARQIAAVPDKQASRPADQWASWLQANAAKLGIKKDEIEWSGILDYLALRGKDKVTRDDIGAYLDQNGVRVQEVERGQSLNPPTPTVEQLEQARPDDAALVREHGFEPVAHPDLDGVLVFSHPDGDDYVEARHLRTDYGVDRATEAAAKRLTEAFSNMASVSDNTRYGKYTLPGGENYRELLLTLPLKPFDREAFKQAVADGRDEDAERMRQEHAAGTYRSSHWDEPNILAHIRFNDRTDADGNKVLFIEELQSDWGQQGKRDGFAGSLADARFPSRDKAERANQIARGDGVVEVNGQWAFKRNPANLTPEAPFVTDTKAWLSLGIKRMIRYAAENGYDKIAFVNGQQSADRYDLSKQISRLTYSNFTGNDGGTVVAYGKGDQELVREHVATKADLEGIVGKETAEKLLAVPPKPGLAGSQRRELTGIDLKVGGEGMNTFYDRIVPQTINEVLKKLGGGKVGTVDLATRSTEPADLYEYTGPTRTLDELRDALAISRRSGGDIHDNPLTGKRELFAFNRSVNSVDLGRLIGLMEQGQSFQQAMLHPDLSSPAFAELMGGRLASRDPASVPHTAQAQPGFTITDVLRTKATEGMPLFARAAGNASALDQSLHAAVEAGASAADLLHTIASDSTDPGHRALAAQLLANGVNPTIGTGSAEGQAFATGRAAQDYAASYDPKAHHVALYEAGGAERNLLHELVHAATAQALRAGGKAALQMKALYAAARRSGLLSSHYGMANIDEFVAEAHSNPAFQQALQKVGGERSLWDRFVDIVRAVLGLAPSQRDMLTQVLAAGRDLMAENAGRADAASMGNIAQTATRAFRDWFGDSKVVNPDGTPMVVYHGTRKPSFTEFDPERSGAASGRQAAGIGSYFTENRESANLYTVDPRTGNETGAVMPVYLHIRNPYMANGWPLGQDATRAQAQAFTRDLKSQGYDGIIINHGRSREFVAFSPEQIKSATGNSGAFDPANPSIMGNLPANDPNAAASESPLTLAARRRFDQVMVEAEHWLNSNGKTAELHDLAPRWAMDSLDQTMYYSTGNFSEEAKAQGRAIWTRAEAAFKQIARHGGDLEGGAPLMGNLRDTPSLPDALVNAATNPRDINLWGGYKVGDFLNNTGKVGWWHKTIGTMKNLALKHPAFRPVYEAVQSFLSDVSRYATAAGDLAPRLMPQLENFKDIFGANRKKAVSAEDTRAIATPIFDGTLVWARDAHGKPVLVDDLRKQAENLTPDQKAQILLQKGELDDQQYKAWRALPPDTHDAAVENRFEATQLQPGVVWTDAELRSMFNLNDGQIGLYHEFRDAVDKSLTNLTISEMVRMAGKPDPALVAQAVAMPSLGSAAALLRDHYVALAQLHPDMADMHLGTATQIMNLADKGQKLIDRGYAPLQRFGQYTVYMTEEGEEPYFGMYETAADAAQAARTLKEKFPAAFIRQGTMSQEEYKLFAGVSPESVELFGSMLGLGGDSDASDKAYQKYLQLTKANRSAMKRMIHRKGTAGYSEDVGRVLASFLYSNARLTSSNFHTGEIDEGVNEIPKEQGELKDEAIALRQHVRDPQSGGTFLSSLMFAQFLGGSVASAAVNFTQPVMTSLPYLSQWGGIGKAGSRLLAAVRDARKESTGDAALDAALEQYKDVVSPQEVHYMQAQAAGKATLRAGDGTRAGDLRAKANNTMAAVRVAWGKLFAMAEQSNRRITFIAAYRTAMEQGNLGDAGKFAAQAVRDTQFVANAGNKMAWGRNPVGSLLLTFKGFSIQYLEMLGKMAFAGAPGSPERAAGRRAVLYAMAVMLLMAGSRGIPFEQDLEAVIDGILQRMGYNFSSKRAMHAFLANKLGDGFADFAASGASGLPGAPFDMAGRLGAGHLIPGIGALRKKESYTSDVAEIAGPAADLVKRGFTAAGKAVGGDLAGAALDLSPQAVRNAAQGVDMLRTGTYRDARGYIVNHTTPLEAGMKALGFQPNSTADIQDAKRTALDMISQARMRSNEIAERWAQGRANNDEAMVNEARAMRDDWNAKNPDTPVRVSMPGVIHRARAMREDALQRTQQTAGKALKAAVGRELAAVRE